MEKPKETKKKKKILSPETRRATSPLLLLGKSFTNALVNENITLPQHEVQEKCFEVLGLMEEYYREPASNVDLERTKSRFEGAEGLDDFLNCFDQDGDEDTPFPETLVLAEPGTEFLTEAPKLEASKMELVKQHRDLIKSRIRKLLAIPQVRTLLQKELANELTKFKGAKKKLQRLQRVKNAIERATLDMHSTYLESKKKHHGVLVESAGRKIEKLSKIVNEAKKEEEDTVSKANAVERGFITTRELLTYKRQMAEKGVALTPSRRALLQRIVEHSMSGQKVFLVGSTGTGKTELAFYAVNEVTGDYEIIPWHEGTVTRDVLGHMQLTQNHGGQVVSSFKEGPLVRGYTQGRGVVHEEITAGFPGTMMGMKPYLNLRPGQFFKIPEMNGTILQVNQEILMEIFTGNPKSEQTTEREDLDPAILRMMKGIQVEYMPPNEMVKIVLAKLMEESGLLKLAKSDVDLIQKLAESAHIMQMCHENTIEGSAADALKAACGIDDLRITKNFLDSGSFLGLFAKYDYERRKGKSLRTYLQEQLDEFLHDPKNINAPEERTLALGILKLNGVLASKSTLKTVAITGKDRKSAKEKFYILPSEMGFLDGTATLLDDDPLATETELDADIEVTFGEIKGILGAATEPALLTRSPSSDLAAINSSIDALSLSAPEKKKLEEMFEGYDESVATAREVDPTVQIKSIMDVYAEFAKLGLPKLKEIANFARPLLLVVPKNGFLEKKAEMNKHKPYIHPADKKTQDDAFHWDADESPFKAVSAPAQTTISVVDGAAHMPHIQGIPSNSRFDVRKQAFKDHFRAKGMRLINVHEDAVLIQRSLREYERNNKDVDKIVDYYEGDATVSCLDDEYMTSSTRVACGYFSLVDRQVAFVANFPDGTGGDLRGRPSVQVMAY